MCYLASFFLLTVICFIFLICKGYALYSSATTLVFTLGCGVNGFTLDEKIGEFVLTHPNIRIPSRGKIYSFNEAVSNGVMGSLCE